MPTVDERKNLPRNLRFLCRFQESGSAVARAVGLNRQQFEKYLSGRSFPSLSARHRLAEYFGVDIQALAGPADQFADGYRDVKQSRTNPGFETPRSSDADLHVLRNYIGTFQTFFLTPAWPDRIYVGLVFVKEEARQINTVFFNRARDPETNDLHRSRLDGRLVLRGERLFLLERTRATDDRFSETILFPSHGRSGKYLTGMLFGVTWRPHRMPFASRTIWRRVASSGDVRSVMSQCGIYHPTERTIDPIVRNFFGSDLKAYTMSTH